MYENSYIPIVLSKVSVKIHCKSGNSGSGILYRLTTNKEFICAITATHCLKNEIGEISSIQDISIQRDKSTYDLILTDKILIHPSADFAVLICRTSDLELSFGEVPQLLLAEDNAGELETLFYGFPEAATESMPVRVNTTLIPPIADGFIYLESSLKSETNLTENTLTGFSGSGIALKCAGNIYLIGIIVQITEWNRFKGLSIKFFNDLLTEHTFSKEPISLLEANPELIRSYSLLKKNSNALFADINETIGTIHITRIDAIQLASEKLQTANVLIVTGIAGVGKSTFAKELVKHLEVENNAKAISFYGSQICKLNFVELLGQFGITNDIGEILKSRDLSGCKIIYIDSAEKAFENNQLEVLKAILRLSVEYSNLKVILSIRSYALTLTTFGLLRSLPLAAERLILELLNEEEMLLVTHTYPRLVPLLANPKIASFVRTPFYLNLILNMLDEFEGIELNEQLLKVKLWGSIIKKDSISRELTFEQIAIKRAVAMQPFVRLNGLLDAHSIKSLLFDHVVNESTDSFGLSSYAPSHDIFEDWAMVRHTQQEFDTATDISTFFNNIGNSFAVRRGFRFWLQELYRIDTKKAQEITLNTLKNSSTPDSWKDEVIISLLNSTDCQQFLSVNEEALLAGEGALFKKCIHLVRTSCKEPSGERQLQHFLDEQTFMTSNTMKPVGPGWNALVAFIVMHPTLLNQHLGLAIGFLLEWGKLDPAVLRPASKDAATIIFALIPVLNKQYSKRGEELHDQWLIGLIKTLFNLTEDNSEEVSSFISKSFQFVKLKSNRINGNSTITEIDNLSYHEKIIALCLDYRSSEMLCRFLPELMWEMLINDWIAPSPVAKKSQTRTYHPLSSLIQSRRLEPDELFGFRRHGRRDYSPVSAFQTPLPHLLKYHLETALSKVIKILNEATIKYCKSKFSVFEMITLVLDGNRKKDQYGSESFWRMYRGGVQMPELAECILMAIENHLLSLAAEKSPTAITALLKSIDLLYQQSVTVATTSVIASVSMAYPLLVGGRVIPLFTFKQAFQWDFQRSISEEDIFTPPDISGELPEAQRERIVSKNLPHRKERLEFLAFKMSLYKPYSKRILTIIDNYLKEINDDVLAKFTNWPFVLNRIDKRQYQITSATIEGIVLEGVLPENLQKKADIINQEMGDQAGIDLWNWCHLILDKGDLSLNTIDKWRFYKNISNKLSLTDALDSTLYNVPAGIAGIGLTHFFDQFNPAEKEWCIQTIISVSEFFLEEEFRDFKLGIGKYPDWNKEPAYTHLPMLLNFVDQEVELTKIKGLIKRILQVTGVDNDNNKPIFESIARRCWSANVDFAKQCFNELVYIAIQPRWQYGSELNEVVAVMPELKFTDNYNGQYYLDKAFLFISEAEEIDREGSEFLMFYQDFLFNKNVGKNSERKYSNGDYYYGSFNFQFKYGYLMLSQPYKVAEPLFSKLIGYLTIGTPEEMLLISNECIQMIFECFKNIFTYEDKSAQTDRFFELWKVLLIKTVTTGRLVFLRFLLLDWYWKDTARSWPLIREQKQFFCRILSELGIYDIDRSIKLMAGIGFDDLFPESLALFLKIVKAAKNHEWRLQYNTEKYIQRAFYMNGTIIKANNQHKLDFLTILDEMIDGGSSIAYLIKESIVSL